jgi:hypothetical protein
MRQKSLQSPLEMAGLVFFHPARPKKERPKKGIRVYDSKHLWKSLFLGHQPG